MDYSKVFEIAEKYGAKTLSDEPMKGYTTFCIGGKADVLISANSVECVCEIIEYCKENNIKYYIFGKGSNILVSDNGLKGVVILISGDFSAIERDGDVLVCEAGASMSKLCLTAKDNSLTGLEFAYGIPGTVGGGLYMNAGAYGGELKDVVLYCDYLDNDGSVKRMYKDEMELSYRHSAFSGTDKVILKVAVKLSVGDKQAISDRMNEIMNKRREKQPLEYPSAGSTFKRPVGDFAGRLIEASGLKGYSCGGAEVSTKHSGFVVNKGGATFDDVINVVNGVKEKVYKDSGVMLECEILVIE